MTDVTVAPDGDATLRRPERRGLPLLRVGRLEAFSDGVFAIAITLLVIEIRPPEDTAHLAHELAKLWPSYLAYVDSFLLIGLVWANHHVMFDHIRRVDRPLTFLNTLLLMDVAFIPFAAAVLASAFRSGEGRGTAVVLYGVVLVVGGIFFNAIWEVARRRALIDPSMAPATVHRIRRRFFLGPCMYAVAATVGAFAPFVGFAGYAALILFYWLPVGSEG